MPEVREKHPKCQELAAEAPALPSIFNLLCLHCILSYTQKVCSQNSLPATSEEEKYKTKSAEFQLLSILPFELAKNKIACLNCEQTLYYRRQHTSLVPVNKGSSKKYIKHQQNCNGVSVVGANKPPPHISSHSALKNYLQALRSFSLRDQRRCLEEPPAV